MRQRLTSSLRTSTWRAAQAPATKVIHSSREQPAGLRDASRHDDARGHRSSCRRARCLRRKSDSRHLGGPCPGSAIFHQALPSNLAAATNHLKINSLKLIIATCHQGYPPLVSTTRDVRHPAVPGRVVSPCGGSKPITARTCGSARKPSRGNGLRRVTACYPQSCPQFEGTVCRYVGTAPVRFRSAARRYGNGLKTQSCQWLGIQAGRPAPRVVHRLPG